MMDDRRSFRREPEEIRREALIAAALDLMAEGGASAATARAIASRAGVTAGLIRHYFASKEDLTRAAYSALMERLTLGSEAACGSAETPAAALAALIRASLTPPVTDSARLRLWAGFLQMVQNDPAMRDIHASTYLHYRDLIQSQIERLPCGVDPDRSRALAIACNAVIDGLWLEGSALPERFATGEMEQIGRMAISAILGTDLPPCAKGPAP